VVKISAVWISALACAGGRPMVSIAAFASTPYAMPSVPSTNCATKPIASSSTNSVVTQCPLYFSRYSATFSGMKLSPPHVQCRGTLCHAATECSSRQAGIREDGEQTEPPSH
jgi:hypothetical protein